MYATRLGSERCRWSRASTAPPPTARHWFAHRSWPMLTAQLHQRQLVLRVCRRVTLITGSLACVLTMCGSAALLLLNESRRCSTSAARSRWLSSTSTATPTCQRHSACVRHWMSWAGDGSRLTRMTRHGTASWNPRRLLGGAAAGALCCCVDFKPGAWRNFCGVCLCMWDFKWG